MTNPLDEAITLLLVEDDDGHARLIERNLRRSNIQNPIIRFDTGRKFLDFFFDEKVPKTTPESYLVLLDLNLPEADGYEILRRVKSDPEKHIVPVVILTTTSNPREVARCYELGCNMYVTKPVDYDSFSDAMSKLALILSIVKIPNG